MPHALSAFIREQMDARGLRNRDLEQRSGLSRQLVSKLVNDRRAELTRLPAKTTIDGLARAFGTSTEIVLGKAVEALGLGFTSSDLVYGVTDASDEELLDELRVRLAARTAQHRPVGVAARSATERGSEGRRVRLVQDDDAVRPDEPGPEGGA